MTNINKWFLTRLENIFPMKQSFRTLGHVAYEYTMASSCVSPDLLYWLKHLGLSDRQLAVCLGTNELAVCRLSEEHGDFFTKQIDTAAASFHAYPNYLYCTYNADDFPNHEVTVVGAGAYGIGSAVGPFPERRHRGDIEGCDNLWPDDVSPSHHPSWVRKPDSDHATLLANISDSSAMGTICLASWRLPPMPGLWTKMICTRRSGHSLGHFAPWPVDKRISTGAKGADILSASQDSRSIYIHDV